MSTQPGGLPAEAVARSRRVLAEHYAPSGGVCPVCGVRRCREWTDAYDRLAAAHQVMTDPDRWDGPLPERPSPPPYWLAARAGPPGAAG